MSSFTCFELSHQKKLKSNFIPLLPKCKYEVKKPKRKKVEKFNRFMQQNCW